MSLSVGGGCDCPVAGWCYPDDDAGPDVFEAPFGCLFQAVVVSAEHGEVARAGRAAALEWDRVVGVAVSCGAAAAGEAASAVAVFDCAAYRCRRAIAVTGGAPWGFQGCQ